MDTFLITPDLVFDPAAESSSISCVNDAVQLLKNNTRVVTNSTEMAKDILLGLGYTPELADFRIDYAINGCAVAEFAL